VPLGVVLGLATVGVVVAGVLAARRQAPLPPPLPPVVAPVSTREAEPPPPPPSHPEIDAGHVSSAESVPARSLEPEAPPRAPPASQPAINAGHASSSGSVPAGSLTPEEREKEIARLRKQQEDSIEANAVQMTKEDPNVQMLVRLRGEDNPDFQRFFQAKLAYNRQFLKEVDALGERCFNLGLKLGASDEIGQRVLKSLITRYGGQGVVLRCSDEALEKRFREEMRLDGFLKK
jgi:hypothetical protein